jgi:signal transduction histidine kinase
VTPVQVAFPRYRIALRLWVMLSVAMALAATASTLAVLYLQRPFIAARGGFAPGVQNALFAAAVAAGGLAGLGGLVLGVAWSRRIWAIVERTNAAVPTADGAPGRRVSDELGALDAAVGRLTLSMDRFISDSDILARLPAAMLLVDDARRLLSFNVTAETLLGPDLARFLARPLLGVDGPLPVARGNEPLAHAMDQAERAGVVLHMDEVQACTWSGRPLLFDVTIQIRLGRESGVGSVLLLRDASERRRIREQIKRADQLALLGGMAARIAHEVRTPLATLRGLVELLQVDLVERERPRQYLERILQAIERQEQLVEKLLSFTHPEPESWQPVLVHELLQSMIEVWPGRRPSLAVERPLTPVNGDPVLLSQVFANLIQNALEASRDGAVAVRVRMHDGAVQVTVTNEGAGIPPELQERIFEPFFTTKQRGTGLGLAIARQVVEAHRGAIRVESDGLTATTFVVDLPSLQQPAAVTASG